jgi:hypothetical protein
MPQALPESREELLSHLEHLTGQTFRTHDDVRNFVAALDVEKTGEQERKKSTWSVIKSTTLLVLLIFAFVQFYLADALLQMMSLREMTFFVPVNTTTQEVRSALPVNDRG